jgi:RNA polymerase sigma-70 factor (ECF subfamily)
MLKVVTSNKVVAAAKGDEAAFAELYRLHSQSIYNLVLRSVLDRSVAQDVCQEIWIKVHRDLPKLREPAAFRTWLFKIAARACIDAARARQSRITITSMAIDCIASDFANPELVTMQREDEGRMWQALLLLPQRQQVALFLREAESRPYREIAEILQTSESAVETLLFRARRLLSEAQHRVEYDRPGLCQHAREAMTAVLDRTGTTVQKLALRAHVETCRSCRTELQRMQRASKAYAALPLLPIPDLVARPWLDVSTMGGLQALNMCVRKLFTTTALKFETAALTVTVGGTALTTMILPVSGPQPAIFSHHSQAADASSNQMLTSEEEVNSPPSNTLNTNITSHEPVAGPVSRPELLQNVSTYENPVTFETRHPPSLSASSGIDHASVHPPSSGMADNTSATESNSPANTQSGHTVASSPGSSNIERDTDLPSSNQFSAEDNPELLAELSLANDVELDTSIGANVGVSVELVNRIEVSADIGANAIVDLEPNSIAQINAGVVIDATVGTVTQSTSDVGIDLGIDTKITLDVAEDTEVSSEVPLDAAVTLDVALLPLPEGLAESIVPVQSLAVVDVP